MASFAAPQFQQSTSPNPGKEASTNGAATQSVGEKLSSSSIQRIEEEPQNEQNGGANQLKQK